MPKKQPPLPAPTVINVDKHGREFDIKTAHFGREGREDVFRALETFVATHPRRTTNEAR